MSRSRPLPSSQTRIRPSKLPVARSLLFGLMATAYTTEPTLTARSSAPENGVPHPGSAIGAGQTSELLLR